MTYKHTAKSITGSITGKAAAKQRGLAVVECVIALPVVLFMILAVAEMGNAILQYNTLTQTVRDGARFIAEDAGAGTGVVALTDAKIAVTKNLVAYGISGSGTAILPGLDPANITVAIVNAYDVSVKVQYDYRPMFAGGIPALVGSGSSGGAFTMNAEVIMRVL